MTDRPRILDLFCCAGGAAMGLHRAGFEVVGVDIEPQPHYPFEFHQADAMTYPLRGFDAYWASPPCQHYSAGTPDKSKHPDLLGAVRCLLEAADGLWIIENVPGAPMRADFRITGDMVGLPLIKRARWFETNWYDSIAMVAHVPVTGPVITVTGHGTTSGNRETWGRNIRVAEMRAAMGIEWMNRDELSQAIPPAYSEYIGRHLLRALADRATKGSAPAGRPGR